MYRPNLHVHPSLVVPVRPPVHQSSTFTVPPNQDSASWSDMSGVGLVNGVKVSRELL